MTYTDYLNASRTKPPYPEVVELTKMLPPGAHILDLGAGAGNDAEFLARSGYNVTAVDREPQSCERIRERCQGLPVTVIESDFRDLSLPPESFDAVVSIMSLPFLPEANARVVYSKLSSWLKPHAQIVLALFGRTDDWFVSNRVSVIHDSEVAAALNAVVVQRREREHDASPAAGGPAKHWDIVHLVLRKNE